MFAYHCQSNAILVAPFQYCKDTYYLGAYNYIMQRLKDKVLHVNLHILDIEASKYFRRTMNQYWDVKYQLFPPKMHWRNVAERAIQTFKAHFISIMTGDASNFPSHQWDILIP